MFIDCYPTRLLSPGSSNLILLHNRRNILTDCILFILSLLQLSDDGTYSIQSLVLPKLAQRQLGFEHLVNFLQATILELGQEQISTNEREEGH